MFFSKLLFYHRSPQGLPMLFIDQGKFSLSFLHLSGTIISLENRRNLCMFKLNSLRQWCLSPSILAIMFNLKIVIIICILFHGHNANLIYFNGEYKGKLYL